jgi:hypothetical protein
LAGNEKKQNDSKTTDHEKKKTPIANKKNIKIKCSLEKSNKKTKE